MTSDSPPPVDRPLEEPAYRPLEQTEYVPPPPTPYTYPPPMRERPFGVTLLAILMIIGGILSLVAAFGSFALSAVINVQEIMDQIGQEIPQGIIEAIPAFFAVIGIVFLILAVIAFLIAYGYLKGRGWSWTLSVVLLVISIVLDFIGFAASGFNAAGLVGLIIGIAIPVIILVYLFQPRVKAWFGKA